MEISADRIFKPGKSSPADIIKISLPLGLPLRLYLLAAIQRNEYNFKFREISSSERITAARH